MILHYNLRILKNQYYIIKRLHLSNIFTSAKFNNYISNENLLKKIYSIRKLMFSLNYMLILKRVNLNILIS